MTASSTAGLAEVRPFDLGRATEHDQAAYHLLVAESRKADMPEDPPLSYEAAVGRLCHQPLMEGPCTYWAARVQGRIVGFAEVALPGGDNAGVAFAHITVLPELRRCGVGTALLRAAMPVILSAGRGTVIGVGMKADGAGARWTHALGFRVTAQTVLQDLEISAVDPGIWDVPTPTGYRIIRWVGATPGELLESFAAARPAIRDAPLGQVSYHETAWTPQLIRQEEQDLAAHGTQQRVVAAVEVATGHITGLTAVRSYPHRRTSCVQWDTSVLARHRGHGLGRALKSEMMRWLTAERPELEHVYTSTTAENSHMINVNLAVGYHPVRAMIWTEIPAPQLAQTLAS